MEAANLMGGMGGERADEVLPGVLDWINRRGRQDEWFLHVHLWDPHTPYNTPDAYGNPFADEPIPAWHTEEVRAANWLRPGPRSAQEPSGFAPGEWGPPRPRQPAQLADMADVKSIFDGYDIGIRYADDALGTIIDLLQDIGVFDETAILISSDHGEAFGELGVYSDHMGADEATAHVPAILSWPGIAPRIYKGLHYHLDLAATMVDMAGIQQPQEEWDGKSIAPHLRDGSSSGRDHLVLTQGAWSCQRGVRTADYLYLHTMHDGYHGWPEEMLFNVADDPHETRDLASEMPEVVGRARSILDVWLKEQLARTPDGIDPLRIVMDEGGPYHVRGQLPAYLQRLRETGRSEWADRLESRHGAEADPAGWSDHRAEMREAYATLVAAMTTTR